MRRGVECDLERPVPELAIIPKSSAKRPSTSIPRAMAPGGAACHLKLTVDLDNFGLCWKSSACNQVKARVSPARAPTSTDLASHRMGGKSQEVCAHAYSSFLTCNLHF